MNLNLNDVAELLQTAGQRQRQERMTKEQKTAEGRKHLDEVTELLLGGCDHPEHKAGEDAGIAFLEGCYNLDVLPERIRKAFPRIIVTDVLHREGPEGFAKLLTADTLTVLLTVAAAIARVYESPTPIGERVAHAGVPLVTGQYA